ncbi:MAG: hypothetical protein ACK5V5_15105 [Cyclobacteriaceae bacterium]
MAYNHLSREELLLSVVELKQELDQLKCLVFGSRHERFVPAVAHEQLALELAVKKVETPAATSVETIAYTRKKKEATEKMPTGRIKLPANLH